MDIIPQVFELARISKSLLGAHQSDVLLTYEDYQKYAKMYQDLPQNARHIVDEMAEARKKMNASSNADSLTGSAAGWKSAR
jgi:uncharacterized protein YukE